MTNSAEKSLRGVGWVLVIGGVLVAVGIGVYALFFTDETPLTAKLVAGGIYGGFALLLIAVLRQRLRERKTDKYTDVEL